MTCIYGKAIAVTLSDFSSAAASDVILILQNGFISPRWWLEIFAC